MSGRLQGGEAVLSALGAAVTRGMEQAAWGEASVGDDKDEAAQRDEGRQRARAGLPFILDDRRMRPPSRPPPEHDPWEKTAEKMRKNNDDRQAKARRTAATRRRRLLAGDDVEETPPDARVLTPQERRAVDPDRRTDTTRDALLERTVHAEPIYVRLIAVCMAENRQWGTFIKEYCALLVEQDREGRDVSADQLAELAAKDAYGWAIATAYRRLAWARRLFSEWAYAEYAAGHIFTEAELAPMRLWITTMNRWGYQAGENTAETVHKSIVVSDNDQ